MSEFIAAAFYKFTTLKDFETKKLPLLRYCERQNVLGTILLAEEGINGTIAGKPAAVRAVLAYLRDDPRLHDLEHKESPAARLPFYRMKVRLKREIVTLGVEGVDPGRRAGTYVRPEDWNALIRDPDVVLIDARNDYEVAIGTFKGAINPHTRSFRELPAWLQEQREIKPATRVAMFCTGGIRCEKSTAYLRSTGVDEVYHLRGGILKYLETIPEDDSLWEGECFVFDERVSVGHGLTAGSYALCRACRHPITQAERSSDLYVEGVSCPHCHAEKTLDQKRRFAERQRQMELADERGHTHLGAVQTSAARLPVLYSFRRCPYAIRARLALAAAGQECQLREVVLRNKPAAMLLASPKGTVPVLVQANGAVLDESIDIMLWALSRSGTHAWLTPDLGSLDEMRSLCALTETRFKPNLDRYKYASRYDDADPLIHREHCGHFLWQLDEMLGEREFLFGKRVALADMAIAPFVRQFALTDREWFDAQGWHKLRIWLQRITQSGLFADVMKKYPPWQEGDRVTQFPLAAHG